MPQPFNNAVMTDAGARLLTSAQAGEVKIEFTRIAVGDGSYVADEKTLDALQKRSDLKALKNSYALSSIEAFSDHSVKMTALITNQDPVSGQTLVSAGYYINEMGLFAKEKDGADSTEILYSIAVTSGDNGDFMPPYNGYNPAEIIQEYYATVSNSAEVVIQVGMGAPALADDLNDAKTSIVELEERLAAAANTATNAYTKANAAANTATNAYTKANAAANTAAGIGVRLNSMGLALGENASVMGGATLALGRNASASDGCAIAVGAFTKAAGNTSTAIGMKANAPRLNSIAIGPNACANGNSSMAIGDSANAGNFCTAVGANAEAYYHYATAIGASVKVSTDRATAVGAYAAVNGSYSVALGTNARVFGNSSMALGGDARVDAVDSVALGHCAMTSNHNSIQLGNASWLSSITAKVSITVTSDGRDKADVEGMPDGAVDFLRKVRAVSYVFNGRGMYIDDENLSEEDRGKKGKYGLCAYDREAHAAGTKKGRRRRVGVVAQEVQEALADTFGSPSYANLVNDSLFDLDPSEIPEDVESQLAVNYEGFIPFLIKAVQELDGRIRKLEDGGN